MSAKNMIQNTIIILPTLLFLLSTAEAANVTKKMNTICEADISPQAKAENIRRLLQTQPDISLNDSAVSLKVALSKSLVDLERQRNAVKELKGRYPDIDPMAAMPENYQPNPYKDLDDHSSEIEKVNSLQETLNTRKSIGYNELASLLEGTSIKYGTQIEIKNGKTNVYPVWLIKDEVVRAQNLPVLSTSSALNSIILESETLKSEIKTLLNLSEGFSLKKIDDGTWVLSSSSNPSILTPVSLPTLMVLGCFLTKEEAVAVASKTLTEGKSNRTPTESTNLSKQKIFHLELALPSIEILTNHSQEPGAPKPAQ